MELNGPLNLGAPHLADRPAELHRELQALEAEVSEQAPLVTAAILAAAAFRLRDETGLITALRLLVGAVAAYEKARVA